MQYGVWLAWGMLVVRDTLRYTLTHVSFVFLDVGKFEAASALTKIVQSPQAARCFNCQRSSRKHHSLFWNVMPWGSSRLEPRLGAGSISGLQGFGGCGTSNAHVAAQQPFLQPHTINLIPRGRE